METIKDTEMNARDQILSGIRKGKMIRENETSMPLFRERRREELLAKWEKIDRRRADRMEELVETFRRECELLLGNVYVAQNSDEACQSLSSIIKEVGIKKILKWDSPILEELGIDHLLDSLKVQDVCSKKTDSLNRLERNDYLESAREAELGISGADFGLANTGTLVLRALPGQERSASLLTPIHVAFVESERILSNTDDLMVRLQLDMAENQSLDSCLTLITGPSKTADIELNLILGVHGPKDLHVIILKTI